MSFNPKKHHRRSVRLPGYDYTRAGAYFITVCTHDRGALFGDVVTGRMQLNAYGRIVKKWWRALPRHFPRVRLDAFVVMPNHVHGIVIIKPRRGEASAGEAPSARSQPSVPPGILAPAPIDASPPFDVDGDVHGQPNVIRKPGEASRHPGTPEPSPTGGAGLDMGGGMADASPLREAGDDGYVGADGRAGWGHRPGGATGTRSGSLGAIVQSFKSTASRTINRRRGTPGGLVWQRGYWERILRDERALHIARRYIVDNPARWEQDRLNWERGSL